MFRWLVVLQVLCSGVPRAWAAALPPYDGASTRQSVLRTIWENGQIPARSVPDKIAPVRNVSRLAPHARQITWNVSGANFLLSSTVFYNPRSAAGRSDTIVMHHHGHAKSCDNAAGCPIWFDFYNVTSFIHDELQADYFMLYMPLLGPNQQHGYPESHQWFSQWEAQGDRTIRYFVEPVHLTINYAMSLGYKRVVMMGKSGGGWTTTICSALDPRIHVSFPIAGSLPLSFPSTRDYEQCPFPGVKTQCPGGGKHYHHPWTPLPQPANPDWYLATANYTELYMLAAWEPGRTSLQLLHEYDPCCFAGHGRHAGILQYNAAIRSVLGGGGGGGDGGAASAHGTFSTAISDWNVHAVCPMDKLILKTALAQTREPHPDLDHLPCDILRAAANSTGRRCPFAAPPAPAPPGETRSTEKNAPLN
jgi:hypothetical protein